MTPERWEAARSLFERALALAEEERAAVSRIRRSDSRAGTWSSSIASSPAG